MYYITVTSSQGIPCEAPLWDLVEEDLSYTVSSDHPLVIRCPALSDACAFIGAVRSSANIDRLELSGRRPARLILAEAQAPQQKGSRVETLIDRAQKSAAQVRGTLQLQ